ncbi:uncharacterized protein METZ01_LOCUS462087 [marine metagenome]|uniref:Uncharacterized protein n=1 Tax=marine metagenome TaxID=408172 RepID=A0A383ANQ7_9ZZZZ
MDKSLKYQVFLMLKEVPTQNRFYHIR